MFEELSSLRRINYGALSMDKFLKSHKLSCINHRHLTLNLDSFVNKTAYSMYSVKDNIPRLERITSSSHPYFVLELPIMNISYSYAINVYQRNQREIEAEFDSSIIKTLDSIVDRAKRQICPSAPYLIEGYFLDCGLNSNFDPVDLRNTITRNFGIVLYKTGEIYNEPRKFNFY